MELSQRLFFQIRNELAKKLFSVAMDEIKDQFLKNCGLHSFKLVQMPQDASSKSYSRIWAEDSSWSMILMHYPEDALSFDKFIVIAKALSQIGLVTPKIIDFDSQNSLVLLQDFGDISINKHLKNKSVDKLFLYKRLVDVMLEMQKLPPSLLSHHAASYSKELLLKELNVFINWYLPYIDLQNHELFAEKYIELSKQAQNLLPNSNDVFVHRDFHVDNLFLVNGGIGILDFQDALFGSHLYDLVSLLDDARAEVPADLRDQIISYYAKKTGGDIDQITRSYHIIGAQRNSRILGVFARKTMQGNNNYVSFMPRVLDYLRQNVAICQLKELQELMHIILAKNIML
jgi:aminoglycoside/choline kinase family phosphotransferase